MIFFILFFGVLSEDSYQTIFNQFEATLRSYRVLSTLSDMQWLVSKRIEDRVDLYFDYLNEKTMDITEKEFEILERRMNALLKSDSLLENLEDQEWELYMQKLKLESKLNAFY